MTLLLFLAACWLWRWLRRNPAPEPSPAPTLLTDSFLTEARKTHPKEMEQVDFASWELQMETEDPWS